MQERDRDPRQHGRLHGRNHGVRVRGRVEGSLLFAGQDEKGGRRTERADDGGRHRGLRDGLHEGRKQGSRCLGHAASPEKGHAAAQSHEEGPEPRQTEHPGVQRRDPGLRRGLRHETGLPDPPGRRGERDSPNAVYLRISDDGVRAHQLRGQREQGVSLDEGGQHRGQRDHLRSRHQLLPQGEGIEARTAAAEKNDQGRTLAERCYAQHGNDRPDRCGKVLRQRKGPAGLQADEIEVRRRPWTTQPIHLQHPRQLLCRDQATRGLRGLSGQDAKGGLQARRGFVHDDRHGLRACPPAAEGAQPDGKHAKRRVRFLRRQGAERGLQEGRQGRERRGPEFCGVRRGEAEHIPETEPNGNLSRRCRWRPG
mmetsp:Transcript_22476/g.47550  ORF Transcript_22476/g.47550 Transcript_22476/m.47550 type:complete len:367 (+) Transcript_22476:878-1978(+)